MLPPTDFASICFNASNLEQLMDGTTFQSPADHIKIHTVIRIAQDAPVISRMQLMSLEASAGRPHDQLTRECSFSYLADEALGKAEAQRRHARALHAPRGNPRVRLEELLLSGLRRTRLDSKLRNIPST